MSWLDKYQYGGNVKKIDSTLNANKHLGWVDRLYQKNGENIQIEGQEGTSTVVLSTAVSAVSGLISKLFNHSSYPF